MRDTALDIPCSKCGHMIQPEEIHLCGTDAEMFKQAEAELYGMFQGNRRRFKRHLKKMRITQYDAVLKYF